VWTHPPHADLFTRLLAGYPEAKKAVESLAMNDDALHPRLLTWFVELLAVFDPVCARAYSDYVASSLEAAKLSAQVQANVIAAK
jgi:hypothetical protein